MAPIMWLGSRYVKCVGSCDGIDNAVCSIKYQTLSVGGHFGVTLTTNINLMNEVIIIV